MAVDYEFEYNLRARVPEHAEIFAAWARDAELYRAEMLKRDRAELGLSYGDTPRQFIDLFLAEGGEAAPLAIYIHGGYWRALDPSSSSHPIATSCRCPWAYSAVIVRQRVRPKAGPMTGSGGRSSNRRQRVVALPCHEDAFVFTGCPLSRA